MFEAGFAPLRHLMRRAVWVALGMTLVLLSGCKTELYAKITETDANAVLDVLFAEGISAKKIAADDTFWRIEVEEQDHQRALHVTRQQGVPKERFATMGDLFKKEGLVSSPSEERLRYVFAVSQELSNTLSQIDGVVSARVHPVIPTHDPLADKDKIRVPSAAIFIKHMPDADLQQMAPAIKTLVTRSIEGLAVENVSLTFFAARAPSRPQAAVAAMASAPSNDALIALATLLAAALAIALLVLGFYLRQRSKAKKISKGTTVQRAHGAVVDMVDKNKASIAS
jgi:type III secretion protein J